MLSCTRKGVLGEYSVAEHFIKLGLEVFSNHVPDGPADLVIWNQETNTHINVDVKTHKLHSRKDGTKMFPKSANNHPHVYVVHYEPVSGSVWTQDGVYEALGINSPI